MSNPSGTKPYTLTPKTLLKIGQASKILGVSIDTLRRWERLGKIKTIRTPGGTRLYSLEGLKKVNPSSVENFQAKSLSTEELLRKTEQTLDVGGWKLDKEVKGLKLDDPASNFQYLSSKILTNFLFGTAILLVTALVLTSLITASYLIQPKTAQELFKNKSVSTLLTPFHNLAQNAVAIIDPKRAKELGFASKSPPPKLHTPYPKPYQDILAVTASSPFLEINSDTQINGSIYVRDNINNLALEATPSAGTLGLSSGNTTLTVTKDALLDQDVSTTSSPGFDTLNLSGISNQLVFQSGGPAGTLTWTPASARVITLPDATATLVGKDTTDTLTNKSISGSSNTFTNIPNSALTNSKVTVTAGTNLSGGGDVSLGSSVTLSLASSPSISGVIKLADGTAVSPALTFTDDADTGLYRIDTNKIGLITTGTATSGITIDASGNVGIGTISPAYALDVTGTQRVTGASTLQSALTVTGATTLSSTLAVTEATTLSSSLTVTGTTLIDTNTLSVDASTNRVGIGTSVPGPTLGIAGNAGIGNSYSAYSVPANSLIVEGNVGIGTSIPSQKLSLTGGVFLNTPSGVLGSIGGADLGVPPRSIYVSGKYVYISNDNVSGTCSSSDVTGCELRIYDISDPANPAAVGGIDLGISGIARPVFVSGRYLYWGIPAADDGTCSSSDVTGCELRIYDISNPASITVVGGIDLGNSINDVYVSGKYLYLARSALSGTCSGTTLTGCELQIYDISDPANPQPINGVSITNPAGSVLFISGKYAYFGHTVDTTSCTLANIDGCEFSILDISNPASISTVAALDITVGISSIYVSGKYVYISNDNVSGTCSSSDVTGCELRIYDISDPANPAAVGGIDLGTSITQRGTAIRGKYAYLLFNSAVSGTCSSSDVTGCELRIYDISNPANPAAVGGADTGTQAPRALHQSGKYLYAGHFASTGGCSGSDVSGCEVIIYDLAGIDAPAGTIGSLATDMLMVSGNASMKDLNIESLNVGRRGIYSLGPLSVLSSGISNLGALDIRNSAGTALFFVRDNGNVGIGTTSPTANLTVIGTTAVNGNISALKGSIDIGSAGTRFGTIFADEVNATTLVGTLTGGNLTANTFTINSDNDTDDTQDSNLAFERGNSTPNALLTWDSTNDEFDLNSALNITGTIASANGLTLTGFINDIVTPANEHLVLYPGGTGNVGIGTTGPGAYLSVAGNTTIGFGAGSSIAGPANGLGVLGNVGIGTTTANNALSVTGGASFGAYSQITAPSNGIIVSGNVGIGTSIPSQRFQVNTNTVSPVVITSDGSVGIGTTSPMWQFHLKGDTNSDLALAIDNVNSGSAAQAKLIIRSGSASNAFIQFRDQDAVRWNLLTDSSDTMIFSYLGTSTKMLIDNTGNVGIGTSAAGAALQVNGGVAVGWGTTSTALNSGTIAGFNGNVGIGTSTADYNLSVIGTANITGNLTLGGSLTSSGNLLPSADNTYDLGSTSARWANLHLGPGSLTVHNDATNTNWSKLDFAGSTAQLITDSSTPLQLVTGANNLGMYLNTSGNVGIGTTAPAYKLDIATSTASDRGINIANTAATGTNYGIYSSVTGAASANIGGYFAATGATTSRGLEVAALTSATSTGLTIGALSGTTADTGINIGAISGTGAAGTGITIGNISTTGTTNYGLQLGTMTGGTTSNYQISTGVLTSATTTTNAQLNLGGVVTTGGTTNYGINVGALSGTGTTNYGVNVNTLTSTGTTNYGLNIGGATGAATTNYGLLIGAVSGAATNYGLYTTSGTTVLNATSGNVGIGATTPAATLDIASGTLATDGTQNSLKLAATVPTTPTANITGIDYTLTSAGSQSFVQTGMILTLAAGYTGASRTWSLSVLNNAAGTSSTYRNDTAGIGYRPDGNSGAQLLMNATTTGINTAVQGRAAGGNTNYGIWGTTTVAKASATNVAVAGFALNTGASSTQIAGLFSLADYATSAPTMTSTALLADNGSTTSPIFLARDNGTTVFTIADGGNVGIGTTAPGSKLTIEDATGGVDTFNKGILINNTGGAADGTSGEPAVAFMNKMTGSNYWITGINQNAGSGGYSIAYGTTFSTANTKFIIDTSGNVGIGVTDPGYSLELYDATNTPTFALSDDDIAHGVTTVAQTDTFFHLSSISTTVGGAYLQGLADATGVAFQIRGIQSSDPTDTTPAIKLIGAKASGTGVVDLGAAETVLQIANNDNTPALTVLGNDSVGIGTVTPSSILHLNASAPTLTFTHSSGGNQDNTGVISFLEDAAVGIKIRYDGNANNFYITDRTGSVDTDIFTITRKAEGLGNVGIGTTSPGSKLSVIGNVGIGTSAAGAALQVNGGVAVGWGTTSTALNSGTIAGFNGNVGIGTTSAAYQLALTTDSAAKPGTNTWTVPSDLRLKTNITDFQDGLSIINQINPVNYTLNGKAGTPEGMTGIGIIAQDVKDIIPYTISTFKARLNPDDTTDTSLLSFNSGALTFVTINAIKELDQKISKYSNIIVSSDGSLQIPNLKVDKLVLSQDLKIDTKTLDSSNITMIGNLAFSTDTSDNQFINVLASLISLDQATTQLESSILGLSTQQATQSAKVDSIQSKVFSLQTAQASQSANLSNTKNAVDELKKSLDALSAQISSSDGSVLTANLDLTPPDLLLASGSAILTNLTVKSEATFSGQLTAYDINIQNSLKSLGKTSLGNTTIAGNLSIDGTLSIENGNEINVIGDKLYLQKSSFSEGLDILNGTFTFSKDGTLTVNGTVLASQFAVKGGTTAGVGIIPAGQTDLIIENSYADEKSVILITPHTPLAQTIGAADRAKGGFLVKLAHTELADVTFDYLIIGVKP